MQNRTQFLQTLARRYPALTTEITGPLVSDNLLSDAVVELPASILKQAQDFVAAAFELRQKPSYQQSLAAEAVTRGLRDPGNYSIAMSYDFHVAADGVLKLIEINTNASFLALSQIAYESQGMPLPVSDFSADEIRRDLLRELELNGHSVTKPRVLICDEAPAEQRLYIEFLLYREMMRSWGWDCEILDTRTPGLKADLIYNRDTDFYFEKPELQELKKAWIARQICFSPQPMEYLLLADKERLLEWGRAGFFESHGLSASEIECLRRHLPFATELTAQNAEELWPRRKTLFLKPKRSFGAKQSFRGASISNKAYRELIGQEILAQEYIPAPEIEITTPQGPAKMKYDLRFYAYQGRVQTVIARLYQGQVTNLRTPYGGFTCVKFT